MFTYDPTDPKGPWLVASRTDASQPFQGDLKTIDAKHAYFVRAISGVTLKVDLPTSDPVTLFIPSAIFVRKNSWTLLPVMDLSQGSFRTATKSADQYLGDNWTSAWTYDPTASPPWVELKPGPAGRCGRRR